MKAKKRRKAISAPAPRLGAEAWLAVRARRGAGLHDDRRTAARAVERRRAIEDAG
jgi:hypothetical protein